MEAILNFLHSYAREQIKSGLSVEGVKIYSVGSDYTVQVTKTEFIKLVIIPLFNSLNFRSKKFLDFTD
jgi:hypothetical protein